MQSFINGFPDAVRNVKDPFQADKPKQLIFADRCQTGRSHAAAVRTVGRSAKLTRHNLVFKVRREIKRGAGKDAIRR